MSSRESTLSEHVVREEHALSMIDSPRTPCPPMRLPARRSSLAFGSPKITTKLGIEDFADGRHISSIEQRSRIYTDISAASSRAHDVPSPKSVIDIQRAFQTAKATLHRDMFAASSPASSIESRMNLDQDSPLQKRTKPRSANDMSAKVWRYSTAPVKVAGVATDVREPLPSPTLPQLPPMSESHVTEHGTEPISSGFTSPNLLEVIFGMSTAVATALPQSDTESDSNDMPGIDTAIEQTDDDVELRHRLTRLGVAEDIAANSLLDDLHADSQPSEASLDVLPGSSSEHLIYLSPTAEAAANSAKAKRKRLKIRPNTQSDYSEELGSERLTATEPHQFSSLSPCPDPSAHNTNRDVRRPQSAINVEMFGHDSRYHPTPELPPHASFARATATGSPMPFGKAGFRPSSSQNPYQQQLPPALRLEDRHAVNMRNEHFRPGWYYAQDPGLSPAQPTYSFSTAASKVIGSDQAPDSRIRDSYKTDTLTALARSQKRFKKNGIGAEVDARGVGKYYQRPPSSFRPSSTRSRPGSRQTYDSGRDVRFRSSPPRGPEQGVPLRRKRAMDDSFVVHVDPPQTHSSDEVLELDEQTRAAVRMSIFGTSTPEALRGARQGIKELSPNVQVFRKGTQEHGHLRKKRRPSYWDTDLKEIR